jgi:glycosyltransferase involved in cell wall biosynthesis
LLTATWAGLFVDRPSVVVATSPQFFCGWAGVLVQFFRRVPFVLEIRDLWPESILTVGAMKRGVVIRFLEWLERRMYAAADHIVTVGEGYRDNIALKTDSSKPISVIYNGVDAIRFQHQPADHTLAGDYGFADRFVCTYAGTIGMAHGLETVIDAGEKLRSLGRDDIGFLLVGDGARRKALEELARDRQLTNVRFTGRLDKSRMPEVIGSSDAILVHLKDCRLFSTVIPSKIFEAMAMGRPIVMGVRGESAAIVRDANAGLDMIPGDADSLVDCVCRLADDQSLRELLSRDGRAFVLERFNRNRFAEQMLKLLESVAN